MSLPPCSQNRIAIAPSAPVSSSASAVPLAADAQDSIEAAATAPEADEASVSVDPYVANLLLAVGTPPEGRHLESVRSPIAAPTEPSQIPQVEDGGVVEASEQEEAADSSQSVVAVVNPEFSPVESDSPDDLSEVGAFSSEDLLAAAPLGSEVYAPIVERPEGRLVSPEMPVMPDQEEYLPEVPNRFNGYIWPARGVLTSGYGWRWGRMHRGIDVAGPVGTPIFAAAPGVVVRSGWNSGGYGKLVDIRHADGSLTRYAHNSRLLVEAGQQVRQGQQIAEMGSTGYSTGPHLHFEIHLPDRGAVNPMAHLQG